MGRTVRRIAAELGAEDRGHRAAPLTVELIESADLILTAAREHRAELLSLVAARVAAHLHDPRGRTHCRGHESTRGG